MRVGIYNRRLATLGGGERESLTIAEILAAAHDVEIISPSQTTAEDVYDRLHIDLQRASFVTLTDYSAQRLGAISATYDLFLNVSHWDYFPSRAHRSVLLIFFPYHGRNQPRAWLRYYGARILGSKLLKAPAIASDRVVPGLLQRVHNPIRPDFRDAIATYDALWSISEFSRSWTERYWGRASEILYPPVDVDAFPAGEKGTRILSVGRFFAGSHHKKHADMITAFKQLVDQGLHGWRLTLVGGATPGPIHEAYLQALQAEAEGYPIEINVSPPFEGIGRALRRKQHLLACRRLW